MMPSVCAVDLSQHAGEMRKLCGEAKSLENYLYEPNRSMSLILDRSISIIKRVDCQRDTAKQVLIGVSLPYTEIPVKEAMLQVELQVGELKDILVRMLGRGLRDSNIFSELKTRISLLSIALDELQRLLHTIAGTIVQETTRYGNIIGITKELEVKISTSSNINN